MKKITLLALLIALCVSASAAPARKVVRTIIVEGETIAVVLTGDENCHYWLADDGRKYAEQNDGTFTPISDSTLAAKLKMPKRLPAAVKNAKRISGRQKGNTTYIGQKRALVILAQFADNEFTAFADPKSAYDEVMNKLNYPNPCSPIGSVRDYFLAQSYGKFDFTVDVAGPVILSQPIEYYGKNNAYGDDMRPGQMVWEACTMVDEDIDFTQYDWDGDGEAELVFVLYAGFSESNNADRNTIWPHAWTIDEAREAESGIGSCVFDGIRVNSYACSGELIGTSGNKPDGIGTICHELSHCFGLPDFYCTNGTHNKMCMQSWSLMDYGCYNDDGYTPCSYTAYERWACGWLEPTVLDEPQMVKGLKDIDTDGEAYVIYNQKYNDEYYMLQNIQQAAGGWNSAAEAHGMLILHVDYDASAWEENGPNNVYSHLRMTIVPADNVKSPTTQKGDLYPNAGSASLNTEFTDNSAPAATLFHTNTDGTKLLGRPITGIRESTDGLISFNFNNYKNEAMPNDVMATIDTENTIEASWAEAEGANSYNIRYGSEKPEDEEQVLTIVDEDFAGIPSETGGVLGIGDNLDEYLNTKGFDGDKVYGSTEGLRMGSTSSPGWIESPALTSATGRVTVHVATTLYDKDATFTVKVMNAETKKSISTKKADAGKAVDLEVSVPELFKVRIDATKRLYLNSLQITENSVVETVKEAVIAGITSTKHSFTPEFTADKYWLQVQAVDADGNASDWTEKVEVTEKQGQSEDPVGISNAAQVPFATIIHNLQGQKVQQITRPGIYIVNGKKVAM